MASTNITTRGDQTLIGDSFLVDIASGETGDSFKVYQNVPNPAHPDNSTEITIWTQVGTEHDNCQDALIEAVNLAGAA